MIDAPPEPPKRKLAHAFTKENAKEMARKATQARIQREARERVELEHARTLDETAIALAADEYRLSRLTRTREQLADLDREWKQCDNAKDRKSLSDAIGRLSDLLFALSGWSKPGLTRPRAPGKTPPAPSGPLE